MEKISLCNANNIKSEVYLIRYFKLDYTEYLVYTIFERDEKGFIKLYLIKVMDELGKKVGVTITDEDEWKNMQKVIKTIIKDIKDNKTENFEDLQTSVLEGMKVGHAKFFKLDQNLTDILGGEITEKPAAEVSANNIEENVDCEQMLVKVNEEINELTSILANEVSKLNELKTKFGDLPEPKYSDISKLIVEEKEEVSEENIKQLYENMILKRNKIEDELVNVLLDVANYQLNYKKTGK